MQTKFLIMAKVEVIIKGKSIKVEEHMLSDLARFGVSQNKKTIVPVPREIIQAKLVAQEVKPPEVKTVSQVATQPEMPKEVKPKAKKATPKSK